MCTSHFGNCRRVEAAAKSNSRLQSASIHFGVSNGRGLGYLLDHEIFENAMTGLASTRTKKQGVLTRGRRHPRDESAVFILELNDVVAEGSEERQLACVRLGFDRHAAFAGSAAKAKHRHLVPIEERMLAAKRLGGRPSVGAAALKLENSG